MLERDLADTLECINDPYAWPRVWKQSNRLFSWCVACSKWSSSEHLASITHRKKLEYASAAFTNALPAPGAAPLQLGSSSSSGLQRQEIPSWVLNPERWPIEPVPEPILDNLGNDPTSPSTQHPWPPGTMAADLRPPSPDISMGDNPWSG